MTTQMSLNLPPAQGSLLTSDVFGGDLSIVGEHLLHGSDLVPPALDVQLGPVVVIILVPRCDGYSVKNTKKKNLFP